jgi:predicted DCC family thiol-disulfide oxidoreductase YuxK
LTYRAIRPNNAMSHPIILYDGVCGLCNSMNQFVLGRDPAGVFRFASLQSSLAARILARHGANTSDLDTVYVVISPDQPDEKLLSRSDAVVFVARQLRGMSRVLAAVYSVLPRPVRDWAYGLVARHRYSIFGRFDSCPLPTPQNRARFLDI